MANKFIVSPMSQNINLKAGDVYTGYITVANPAEATEDIHYKATLSPYSKSGEDYRSDFQTMSDWSRIVEWTKLENDKGVLKPNETTKVKFTIQVPENAPAGGQYLSIGVTMDASATSNSDSTIQNVYEMASLVLAEIEGETTHEGKIVTNSISGFVATGSPKTTVTLSNEGNVHEVATAKITVKNVFGGQEVLDTQDDKNVYDITVMPESTRTVERDLEGLPQLGIFEVKQSISYLGQESNTTTVMVICPFWFMALVAATILSIIGMIAYKVHLKKKTKNV